MNRIILSLIMAMSAMFLCCNSQGDNADTDSTERDSTTLRLAVLPTADCLPFYVAEKCGIFDSLGLDIRLTTFNAAADCDTALAGGSVDGMVSDLVKAVVMRSQGDSVKVVMSTELHLYLLSAKNARIRRTGSIKEKIFAITRNSALDMTADKILESVNLNSEELNKPQINDIQLRACMLDQNQYDGALLPEPYATECAEKGAVRLPRTDSTEVGLAAVIFREDAIAGKGEQIGKLAEAYNKAVALTAVMARRNTNTSKGAANEVQGTAPLMTYLPVETTLSDSAYVVIPQRMASLPKQSDFDEAAKWAEGRSLLTKDVKYTDIVDTTFINKQGGNKHAMPPRKAGKTK